VELSWTTHAVSRLIDAVVAWGYATRQLDAADRWRVVIALIGRGVGGAAIISASSRRFDREVTRDLTVANRQLLRQALTRSAARSGSGQGRARCVRDLGRYRSEAGGLP